MGTYEFLALFDGVCDQTKELQTLSGSMSNDVKWIVSSSRRYMFVRFTVGILYSSAGFLAKIHYGNEILNKELVQTKRKIIVQSTSLYICSFVKTVSPNF